MFQKGANLAAMLVVSRYNYPVLDKMPGIRPIGVGKVVKRIIGKAILRTLKEDIQRVVGPLQLCAGYENGVEVASLAM